MKANQPKARPPEAYENMTFYMPCRLCKFIQEYADATMKSRSQFATEVFAQTFNQPQYLPQNIKLNAVTMKGSDE